MGRDRVSILRDETGELVLESRTGYFAALLTLLRAAYVEPPGYLDLLALVEGVQARRPWQVVVDDWAGEGVDARIGVDGVVVTLWHPLGGRRSEQTAYSLDEAHGVLVQYWKAVVSVPERRGRLLVRWEMLNGLEHPCRPHLQPVVDGPERRTR